MYYYTYKITCTVGSFSGKVYFGKHITDNLNDGYIGSGKLLKNHLKKYPNGITREILEFYNSKEELNKAEYNLIHSHLGQPYCLNLREGGDGGALTGDSLKHMKLKKIGKKQSDESNRKRSESLKGKKKTKTHPAWNKGLKTPQNVRKKQSESHKGNKPTKETLVKKSNSMKGKIPYNKGKHKVWDNKELKIYHFEN